VLGGACQPIGDLAQRIFGLIERLYYLSSITWFFVESIELARIGG
jgi:hypothetical protein